MISSFGLSKQLFIEYLERYLETAKSAPEGLVFDVEEQPFTKPVERLSGDTDLLYLGSKTSFTIRMNG
jgi:hypothetical protein